jgi:hypothetical protein
MPVETFKPGDRVSFNGWTNGVVDHVAGERVTAVFKNETVAWPVTGLAKLFSRHYAPRELQIGDYLLRGQEAGKLVIIDTATGEAMQTDAVKLAGAIRQFWTEEF